MRLYSTRSKCSAPEGVMTQMELQSCATTHSRPHVHLRWLQLQAAQSLAAAGPQWGWLGTDQLVSPSTSF
eukprot:4296768-Amphidinium_carterae.1